MIKLKNLLPENIKSDEFEQWFRGSKIIDNSGKPLRVYHGTNKSFSIFKLSPEGVLGKGIYLTPDPKRASEYSAESAFGERRGEGSNVIPLYASIKNPLIVHEDEQYKNPSVDTLVALGVDREKAANVVDKAFERKGNLTGQIYKKAQLQGYDGIVLYRNNEVMEIVAFYKNQIKSAISNNIYSSLNPDITKEVSNCVSIEEGLTDEDNIDEYVVESEQDVKEFVQFMREYKQPLCEAEYRGRKVKLGKPMQGDVKKFKVYVKNPKGKVVKVNFGFGGSSAKGKRMPIKKNNPKRRKSFRARHNCDNPGPRTKARYWSCRKW